MIRFEDVSFAYGGASAGRDALSHVDLELRDGEMLGVVGANGSGKSTLAQLANGLLLPSSGHVTVDGLATCDPERVWEIRAAVSVVFQDPDNQIVGTVVEEDVAFGPENLGLPRAEIRERVDAALAAVDLTELARREPHLLSGGQKQRLAIAGAVAMRPRHLVLDEPTSMLDADGRRDVARIVERLRSAGTSIMLITHDLSDVLSAQRVLVLDGGCVAYCGSPLELLEDDGLLRASGIELPPLTRLSRELRARGFEMDATLADAASVAEALWR